MITLDEIKDLILDCGLEYREEGNEYAYGYYDGCCVVLYFCETGGACVYDAKTQHFDDGDRNESNTIEKVRKKIEKYLELYFKEMKRRKERERDVKIKEIQNCAEGFEV